MQNITLAGWAAWYDTSSQQNYRKAHKKADIDNLPVETEDENNDDEYLLMNILRQVSYLKNQSRKGLKLELSEVFGLIRRQNQRNIIVS